MYLISSCVLLSASLSIPPFFLCLFRRLVICPLKVDPLVVRKQKGVRGLGPTKKRTPGGSTQRKGQGPGGVQQESSAWGWEQAAPNREWPGASCEEGPGALITQAIRNLHLLGVSRPQRVGRINFTLSPNVITLAHPQA